MEVRTLTAKQNNVAAPRRRGHFRWVKMLVLVLAVMAILRLGGQVREYYALNAELELHQEELARVTAEYEATQDELALLSDDAYIERVARDKLGMVGPGETVVMPVQIQAYE